MDNVPFNEIAFDCRSRSCIFFRRKKSNCWPTTTNVIIVKVRNGFKLNHLCKIRAASVSVNQSSSTSVTVRDPRQYVRFIFHWSNYFESHEHDLIDFHTLCVLSINCASRGAGAWWWWTAVHEKTKLNSRHSSWTVNSLSVNRRSTRKKERNTQINFIDSAIRVPFF